MGFNSGKVIGVTLGLIVAGLIYVFTQKEMIEAVSLWLGEALSQNKIKVTEVQEQEKAKPPLILYVEKPALKPGARFAFHYKLFGKSDLVTNAETVNWKILSLDDQQMTWESDTGWLEAYSRNPFLPPLTATETLYQATGRLDYLTAADVFPLSSSEPKVVRIQDRTLSDSLPYSWSCLITGQERMASMGGEFPVEIVTCVVQGGKTGTETFKYSKLHGHWIYRERSGFGLPRLTVELVSYQD